MTKIWLHQYTITKMQRPVTANDKMGVRSIVIEICSESATPESFAAVESALGFFDQDLNISHKILLEGYRND